MTMKLLQINLQMSWEKPVPQLLLSVLQVGKLDKRDTVHKHLYI